MGIFAAKADERVKNVTLTANTLKVDLMDGRTIIVPLAWYPRLLHASPTQRKRWQIAGAATAFTGRMWTNT